MVERFHYISLTMNTTPHSPESDRFALRPAEVAQLLGISVRHLWSLNSSGRLPRPLRLGRSVRWRADELHAWLAAGAPERSRWESIQKGITND